MSVPTPEQAAALRAKIDGAAAPVNATEAARVKAALTGLATAKTQIDSALTTYNAQTTSANKTATIQTQYPVLLARLSDLCDVLAATIKAAVR